MKRLLPVLLALLFSASSAYAQGPDLTGTWTGKGTCTGFAVGTKVKTKVAVTLAITDDTTADALASEIDMTGTSGVPFTATADGCGFVSTLVGVTDKGRAALHGSDTTVPFQKFFNGDLTSVSVSSPDKKGRSGKIKGSVFFGDQTQDLILVCKIQADRTSTTDPAFPPCGQPG